MDDDFAHDLINDHSNGVNYFDDRLLLVISKHSIDIDGDVYDDKHDFRFMLVHVSDKTEDASLVASQPAAV